MSKPTNLSKFTKKYNYYDLDATRRVLNDIKDITDSQEYPKLFEMLEGVIELTEEYSDALKTIEESKL